MLCQICKKNEATIKIVKVIGMNKTEIDVCSDCAKYLMGNSNTSISFTKNSINDILVNLLNAFYNHTQEEISVDESLEKKCPNCGLTYSEFLKSGKLGCDKCYDVYEKHIKPLLSRLHGNYVHVGKMPKAIKINLNRMKKIQIKKEELQKAIKEEEYEKAAVLRDQIIEEEKKAGFDKNDK
ncbi:MAG: UvrB/UvrC motif-containing protein [Atribacterota bacterium]|nr:UvrB/UvrC motif-containing protein [Atribacterota bacterium]